MEPRPLVPVYPFAEAENDIELYRGPAKLCAEEITEVVLKLSMRRKVEIAWEVTVGDHNFSLEDGELEIDHPDYGPCVLPVRLHNGAGLGRVDPVELGNQCPMTRVTCHWANLPQILPGQPLTKDGVGWWRGRWTATANNWRFTIDSRPDISETLRARQRSGEDFVITHTGELTTADGRSFAPDEAADVLFAIQLALSFALGRWVAPCCPVGFDERGERVFEQWAPWRCDPWRGNFHWWYEHRDEDLSEFVSRFVCAFLDESTRAATRHLAVHAISANHGTTTTEGRLMLAQAGLEYLAWIDLVATGRYTKQGFRELGAAGKLRLLLNGASITTTIPPELDALQTLSATRSGGAWDGPTALVWVRNRLVHPKSPAEPYEIEQLVWQSTQLQLEYLELLLLHRLRYERSYLRRYPPGGWPTPIPVPWSAS